MTTLTASRAGSLIGPAAWALRSRLAGEIVTPQDRTFEDAWRRQGGSAGQRPAAIVRAATARDVSEAVSFARNHGLTLTVRTRGELLPAATRVEGALVLDVSALGGDSVAALAG
jgi:FAD/FMN-containing dehydrogenase